MTYEVNSGNVGEVYSSNQTVLDKELVAQKAAAEQAAKLQKAAFDLMAIAAETQNYGLECVRKVRENLQTGLDTCFKNAVKRIETWGAG